MFGGLNSNLGQEAYGSSDFSQRLPDIGALSVSLRHGRRMSGERMVDVYPVYRLFVLHARLNFELGSGHSQKKKDVI